MCIAYLRTQALWQSFVPDSRRENHYCGPIQWGSTDVRSVDNISQFRDWVDDIDRYCWFNVHAYGKHRSLEIRLHTSTLEDAKVCNWVKAHTRFVDWVANGGDINRLVGTLQEQFAVLSEIWADESLSEFYCERAAKWGTDLTPVKSIPIPTPLFDLLEVS